MSIRLLAVMASLVLLGAACGGFVADVAENLASEQAADEADEADAAPVATPLPTLDAEDLASAEAFFSEAAERVVLPDFDLGDCFTVAFQTGGQGAEVVDCAEPHEGEVLHQFAFAAEDPFPDEEALGARVGEECLPAFDAYTGQVFEEQTALQLGYFSPTALSWEDGDRDVHCYLADAAGGDLQGSHATGS